MLTTENLRNMMSHAKVIHFMPSTSVIQFMPHSIYNAVCSSKLSLLCWLLINIDLSSFQHTFYCLSAYCECALKFRWCACACIFNRLQSVFSMLTLSQFVLLSEISIYQSFAPPRTGDRPTFMLLWAFLYGNIQKLFSVH